MAKIVNFKLSGDEFFMMSTSKIMVPLQSPCFLQYVVEFAIVLTTFVKRLPSFQGVLLILCYCSQGYILDKEYLVKAKKLRNKVKGLPNINVLHG